MEIQNVPLPVSCADLDNCCKVEGGQEMILFSSRVQGPFQKLNNVNLLNLNFPRKGVIPDPPSLNPRMKRIPCMSVILLLIKTTGHPFSFQNDFLIM